MKFIKYQHVERLGNDEVEGIENGICELYSKLDGTNSSLWITSTGKLMAGSRNRTLSEEKDNANFYSTALKDERYWEFFKKYPMVKLYGEWLVKHTIKDYLDDAWNKFYVFDVTEISGDINELSPEDSDIMRRYIPYDEYVPMLEEFDIEYIPRMDVVENPSYLQLMEYVHKNDFLMKEGCIGEGIIIKNYNYTNKYGRIAWAKIVRDEFKQKSRSKDLDSDKYKELERKIASKYLEKSIIDKVEANIRNERGGWNGKCIPELLGRVYHDFIIEEIWNILKKEKQPVINFKKLNKEITNKIKELKPELF